MKLIITFLAALSLSSCVAESEYLDGNKIFVNSYLATGEQIENEAIKACSEKNAFPVKQGSFTGSGQEYSCISKNLKKLSDEDLCTYTKTPILKEEEVKKEILRRKLISKSHYEEAKKGTIRIGMKECGLYIAYGKAEDVNKTVSSFGVRKQHVYGGLGHREYIYTKNGKITSWQD